MWTADGWEFHFAAASTRAHCHLFWTRQGSRVAYVGAAESLEAEAYVASADVSAGSGAGTTTLSWQMSPLFADKAAEGWRAGHPSADPSLAIHTEVRVAAILYDADTLDLHGDVVATDVATGAVLAEEHPDWRLRRQDHCMLSPEF